jgi:hypothetical protein
VKARKLASTVDITTDGLGDLSIEQLADGTLQIVRRDHSGRQVAALALSRRELSTLADTLNLALIELRTPPVSARASGPSRYGPDGGPAT